MVGLWNKPVGEYLMPSVCASFKIISLESKTWNFLYIDLEFSNSHPSHVHSVTLLLVFLAHLLIPLAPVGKKLKQTKDRVIFSNCDNSKADDKASA